MRKLFTILIVIGIFILSTGCTKEGEDNISQQSLNKASQIKYNTAADSGIDSGSQFDIQLQEFYDFSQKFLVIWNNNIESTTLLLEKFNDKNITLNDKITYSRILREKYEEFYDELKQITPPPEISGTYQYILNALSKRILFFNEFEKGSSIYALTELENESYLYEHLFWEEIDKIFDHYLEKIGKNNNMEI